MPRMWRIAPHCVAELHPLMVTSGNRHGRFLPRMGADDPDGPHPSESSAPIRGRNRPISNVFRDPLTLCSMISSPRAGILSTQLAATDHADSVRDGRPELDRVLDDWLLVDRRRSLYDSLHRLSYSAWRHTGPATRSKTCLASTQSASGDVLSDWCRPDCADGDLRLYWFLHGGRSDSELSIEIGNRTT